MTGHVEAVRGGALTTVQDLGRRGVAHLAVPRAGALDVPAMRLANRLVGNPESAAVLETTGNGVAVTGDSDRWVAVTGALAEVRVDGRGAGWGVPIRLRAGQHLDVGVARRGLRNYLAVSGGIATPEFLGSRSTDLLAGLGPAPVTTGTVLPLGAQPGRPAAVDFAPYAVPSTELDLDCCLGPRDDRLTPDSLAVFGRAAWTVSVDSNRVGLRLQGPALQWRGGGELPSEGLVLGSVQVPSDGQPVLFLADHPTTGGYPVVGVVPEPDVWRCAQAVPGATVRFRIRRLPPV